MAVNPENEPVGGRRDEYQYRDAEAPHTSQYLWGPLCAMIQKDIRGQAPARVLDLGCGNGAFAAHLAARGFDVVAVDPSESAIAEARRAHPNLRVLHGSGYDDLASVLGRFPIVTCLEVIEHCFFQRRIARCIHALLEPGGTAYLSTPFHGYWKNLALALTGRMDAHFTALWDHGHIKFWSVRTVTALCREAGFLGVSVVRVGRVPPLAKSMIVIARKRHDASPAKSF